MTDAEKKMKRYVNSVGRRLNLPRDVKARVMSDFESSISARREAGQTDEQIYEELGMPKKAAADLNEQMKEFAYRKSPWRFVFLGMAIVSALYFVVQGALWLWAFYWLHLTTGASVGIIGGADGPTAVFVTASVGVDWDGVFFLLLLVVGIVGFLRLRKCRSHKK